MLPPLRYTMPQAAPVEAITQPHNADSLPKSPLIWIAIRWLRTSALAKLSWFAPIFSANAITGIVTVIPWFPLPELLIAGRVLPAILASEAAAVRAIE